MNRMNEQKKINMNSWNILLIFCLLIGIVGGMSNLNVMIQNDNKMPVKDCGEFNISYSSLGYVSFCKNSEVNYPLYSDIIKIKGYNWTGYFSIGDFYIGFAIISSFVIVSYLIYSSIYLYYKKRRDYGF